MKQREFFERIGQNIELYRRLLPISKRLRKAFENDCNYGTTKRRENLESKLTEQAIATAKLYGCTIYVQSDPRGCAIYLMPSDTSAKEAEIRYSTIGIAIY